MRLFSLRIIMLMMISFTWEAVVNPIFFLYPVGLIWEKNAAYATEKASFSDKEIQDELYAERNLIHYIRLSGLLTDMLREQRRVFLANKGAEENGISLKAEEFLNEASILASQEMYDESFKVMEKAFYMMSESMKEMSSER